ncbi:type II toxin-antitoxin system death-on-curing family toxin [Histidinibacterium lentulum]|uniref:Type II toxin-antitoxin system death-on-curing family toxin n=1 Tax=Histidinibacterium lentulum TaxID=2480588 RepID=A0A3N2R571_9RHOB|nr:type II toxin-antitoxin system death-on-curing family toxin [Histidinibacterium lentulum]ROU02642.1 type II toxin-antitoxin system death-on-curing family toxin [Histidinibacterium lentulum]
MEPARVPLAAVVAIHDRQIARHGGAAGLRDGTLLEAAADRPRNRFFYGETDLFALSAAYAFGIAKAHAFVDGNKRTAFVTAAAFLRLNGHAFRPDPDEGLRMMEGLAAGEISEEEFRNWLQSGATPLTPTDN